MPTFPIPSAGGMRRLFPWGIAPFLALLLAALPAPAAPPAAAAAARLSLTEALARAERAAPALQARNARLTAAREVAAQADQLPDPQLVLGIDRLPLGSSPLDNGNEMTMRRVGLMQAFPSGAKRRARRDVAERLADRARTLSEVEVLAVREQVAQAWLALWAATRELQALQQLRAQAAVAVKLAEARLAGGAAMATEPLAAKAAALELDDRIAAAEAGRDAARAGLAAWLGVDAPAVGEPTDPPDLGRLPVPETTLLSGIERQRALVQARADATVAAARVDEAVADTHPDWSLMAAYGQRGGGREDMLMLEARVDLPLFRARRQDRLIAARRAELQAANADLDDAARMQREALGRALAQWRGLQSQVALHERQILPLADDRAKATLAAYGGGGPVQPWLDAERDQLEAHLMHVRHLGELAQLWAALAYLMPAETTR